MDLGCSFVALYSRFALRLLAFCDKGMYIQCSERLCGHELRTTQPHWRDRNIHNARLAQEQCRR
jgi:hypothetical protein